MVVQIVQEIHMKTFHVQVCICNLWEMGIILAHVSALQIITLIFLQFLVDGEVGGPSAPAIP